MRTSCINCIFSGDYILEDAEGKNKNVMVCRIYPPAPLDTKKQTVKRARWPIVTKEDFCGKFTAEGSDE